VWNRIQQSLCPLPHSIESRSDYSSKKDRCKEEAHGFSRGRNPTQTTDNLFVRRKYMYIMVNVKESYQSGNRLIVVFNDDKEDGPTVYTPKEAKELKNQLENLV
jgi:hypothetical protein